MGSERGEGGMGEMREMGEMGEGCQGLRPLPRLTAWPHHHLGAHVVVARRRSPRPNNGAEDKGLTLLRCGGMECHPLPERGWSGTY